MRRFQFQVGIALTRARKPMRTISVNAPDYEAALDKARERLDKLAEQRGQEPPVAWTLILIKEVAA